MHQNNCITTECSTENYFNYKKSVSIGLIYAIAYNNKLKVMSCVMVSMCASGTVDRGFEL